MQYEKPLSAPSPNLGDCSNRGKWLKNVSINQCKKCITQPDMFFCDGECMSRYDTNTICSTESLVAKTLDQCDSPCVQSGHPSRFGGCSDRFDCDWQNGENCVIKDERGTCVKTGIPVPIVKKQPSGEKTDDQMAIALSRNKKIGISLFVLVVLLILLFFLMRRKKSRVERFAYWHSY